MPFNWVSKYGGNNSPYGRVNMICIYQALNKVSFHSTNHLLLYVNKIKVCPVLHNILQILNFSKSICATQQQTKKTYIFHEIPVKDIVIGESLSVEEISYQLSKVSIIGFLFKPQRSDIVVVGSEFS